MSSNQQKLSLKSRYGNWMAAAKESHGEKGLQFSIGAEFDAFGIVQREMLKHFGLREDSYLIDVGCGSGRLSIPLAKYLKGRYLGIDIVSDVIDYARENTNRSDWRFEVVDSFRIPESDSTADMVCFFSVLTHLLHEQSYIYLEEAKRVLKPGGVIVFSFLEFAMDFHWNVFQSTVNNEKDNGPHPLNVFIERNAIRAWANRLGLSVIDMIDGDKPFVSLPHPITLDNGNVMDKFGNLGQSICVMSR